MSMYSASYMILTTFLKAWYNRVCTYLKAYIFGPRYQTCWIKISEAADQESVFFTKNHWGALEIKSHYGKGATCVEKINNASQKTYLLRASLSPNLLCTVRKKKWSLDFTLLTCKIMWLNWMTTLTAEAVKPQSPSPQSTESWQPYSPQYWKSARF